MFPQDFSHKPLKAKEKMKMDIRLPQTRENLGETLRLSVEIRWVIKRTGSRSYDAGCFFTDLTDESRKKISRLLEALSIDSRTEVIRQLGTSREDLTAMNRESPDDGELIEELEEL